MYMYRYVLAVWPVWDLLYSLDRTCERVVYVCAGTGRQGTGRQLPALPVDAEDLLETSGPTMADELAIGGRVPTTRRGFVHPDG